MMDGFGRGDKMVDREVWSCNVGKLSSCLLLCSVA